MPNYFDLTLPALSNGSSSSSPSLLAIPAMEESKSLELSSSSAGRSVTAPDRVRDSGIRFSRYRS